MRRDYGLPSEPPGSQQQVVDNRLWSLEEKRQLLGGLRKHGSKRMAQVAEEVPTKSLEQVMKKLVSHRNSLACRQLMMLLIQYLVNGKLAMTYWKHWKSKSQMRDKRAASYVTETHWMGVDGTRTVIDWCEEKKSVHSKLFA